MLTFEHRQKISKSLTGRTHTVSVTTRKKISKTLMGHVVPASVRRKISKGHKGIIFSESHKQKLSEAHLGKKYKPMSSEGKKNLSKAHKGCKSGMKGKHQTEEAKQKISYALTGMFAGSKHPSWQGGISMFPYPFDFNNKLKELVRERDSYICQLCTKTQRQEQSRLSVHHIDYNKENLNPKNLITLCRSCNGKVNSGRKYWMKFFRNGLKLRKVV